MVEPTTNVHSSIFGDGTEPSCTPRPESLWLTYCRLIGLPSGLLISLSAALHQIACKLGKEPTHWGATGLLIGVGVLFSIMLKSRFSRDPRMLAIATSLGSMAMLCGFCFLDLCSDLQILFLVMLSITAATWLAAQNSHREALRTSTDDALIESSPSSFREHQEAFAARDQSVDYAFSEMDDDTISSDFTKDRKASVDDEHRPKWARYAIGILLGAGFVIYMIIVPAVGLIVDRLHPFATQSHELTDMTLSESLRLHAVSGVVMLMFLAMGASIGSFLNVVIYRLPRYRPLLWPPSACPRCTTRIAGADNIPILAWLRLGGRCRSCNAEISPRYATIEALVASIFVLFYYRELLSGGVNLPGRTPNMYNGIVWILLYTKWDLVTMYLFHMLLLALLLAWGMINYDRFHVPRYASIGSISLSVALSAVFPFLIPTASDWESPVSGIPPALMLSLLGCVAGGVCGAVFESIANSLRRPDRNLAAESSFLIAHTPLPDTSDASGESERAVDRQAEVTQRPNDPYGAVAVIPAQGSNAAASAALVGAQLGFEAVLTVFAFATAIYVGGRVGAYGLRRRRTQGIRKIPVTLLIFGVTVAYLVFWRQAEPIFGSSFWLNWQFPPAGNVVPRVLT